MPLTKEETKELGDTLGKLLKEDMGKTIQDALPEAFKIHGLDMDKLKEQIKKPTKRVNLNGDDPEDEEGDISKGVFAWSPDYKSQLIARAKHRGEFKRFGEFLTKINHTTLQRSGMDARLKANNENDGSNGGFTVPDEFVARMLMVEQELAIVRPRAFVMPMTGQTMRIPAINETSRASSLFGGVIAYWLAESGAVTESNPAFRQIQFIARKLTGYTTTSNELLADNAVMLESLLIRLFGIALAYYEDESYIQGTGAGQPVGILNANCLVSVAKETGQTAGSIVAENLDKMYARMLPSSMNSAIWLAHPDAFPQLAKMSRSVGTGGAPVWVSNMVGGPPNSIYGRPLIFSEKCKTTGTAGDIYFADFSYYIIADRSAMTMTSSPHVRFTNDETVHKFVQRLDGQAWLNSAITPRNGSNTFSPFVSLATRS